MAEQARLGAKVRSLRRQAQWKQKDLAERLGVSASYLNLIEHNRRPLSAELLIKLAQLFDVDVTAFAHDEEDRLVSDVMEAFADPMFDREGLTAVDVRDLAATHPALARGVVKLYAAYRNTKQHAEDRSGMQAAGPEEIPQEAHLPTEEVSDMLQRHRNFFPALEDAAERMWRDGALDRNDVYRGLVKYLESNLGVVVRVVELNAMQGAVRRYISERRLLMLSETLAPRSRNFQLAHQIGLMSQSATLDSILEDPELTSPESKRLGRVALGNYFAGAVLMPYEPFLEAAKAERYDIELLGHRFRAGFEQVCHRLTNLRRPGQEGVPFHFLRVDIAGNISKRFSASGLRFARFSGLCPRWNVFESFLTPHMVRRQVFEMPDGKKYFAISRALPTSARRGFHSPVSVHAITIGCELRYARELVYSDGIDLENQETSVPVGVTCRLCERMDCEQRAVPPLRHPIDVNENVRGVSFYVSAPKLGRGGNTP